MITKELWIDGRKANFRKSFPVTKDWMSSSVDASKWLLEINEREFHGQHIYLFLSDSVAQPDNRITRYYKMSKRFLFKETAFKECPWIDEGVIETERGLFFWILLKVNNLALPTIIDHLRMDRGSYLFFTDKEQPSGSIFANLIKTRTRRVQVSIDEYHTVKGLIDLKVTPIRIWGQFDDPELWIEIWKSL